MKLLSLLITLMTLLPQAVSEMDAMYCSDILPWSRQLTGVEGMSPYTMLSYLNKIRADHMARLLKEGDIPVYLAAEKAGFEASASAAGRVFKNYYGVSPAQYRKKKEAPR